MGAGVAELGRVLENRPESVRICRSRRPSKFSSSRVRKAAAASAVGSVTGCAGGDEGRGAQVRPRAARRSRACATTASTSFATASIASPPESDAYSASSCSARSACSGAMAASVTRLFVSWPCSRDCLG